LGGLNRVHLVTVLAFDFNGAFDEQPLEEQFMTGFASILGDTIRHKLSLEDSLRESFGKGMRNKPSFLVIHNM
jgi:hypothetical protein